ncbi:nudix hydrolase 7 isoform X2 [Quercus suber]|uniref:nudix hydrolase 7 isoform X2 n=1 Tax=Quercus suber TaxID=58331 RepID=UPI0032DEB10F
MIPFFFVICSGDRFSFLVRNRTLSTSSMSIEKQVMCQQRVQQVELLSSVNDLYGGVVVNIEKPMDSEVFPPLLRASMSHWRQQGKRAVWIKLPIEHVNLVEAAVKEGFRYHHAEPDYLMLVCWLPKTADTIPANASHRVGVGAFVMNSKREVLVVQENSGYFKGTGVWKLPTGVVDEGEDICTAAVREVKEETGIDTEFVEVLAFSGCQLRTMRPNLLTKNKSSSIMLPKYAYQSQKRTMLVFLHWLLLQTLAKQATSTSIVKI